MKTMVAPALFLALSITSGCGILEKNKENELTNAKFEIPTTVKKNGMVKAIAEYEVGSNGRPLAYQWSLGVPKGSLTKLKELHGAETQFRADILGEYLVTLVVNDGRTESAPITQRVKAENVAPEATVESIPAEMASIGQLVQLDASKSFDCDGDDLEFRWFFDHVPQGSNAEISDPSSPSPTFIADLEGLYAPRVVAFDGIDEGEAAGVFIFAGDNQAPFANGGDDLQVSVGEMVQLDGSLSSDPDSVDEILRYTWSLVQKPAASQADLTAADQRIAQLIPDTVGDYIVELVVADEVGATSLPDQVRITAR